MRLLLAIPLALTAGPALAHVGHLGEVAGHGHWLGAAALGAAIAIGLWQGLRNKGEAEDEAEPESEEISDEEPQEA
ncbi:DUF6732 family protein [Pseudooceanicola atlanticus]|uniref:Uncharacterized protein n=1 Tax=Pseudooceanicola atlanticus TaxID=1461694 RepID=A0A0A0EHL2_9RHOB|nr:DUF6732 family protein [Pseudooceanicola atlanticus]KGM50441.1 hypothetical protein ATO9_02825 [Pseudooceanicola atlanticus]